MKVFQINTVCGTGSTGRIATDIYNILKSKGHSCKIAFGRGEAKGISPDDAVKIGSELGVRVHGVRSRITDKSGFYSKSATKKLIREIEQYDPDVIHLHNIHGYYINIELLFNYLKSANKPVVWTLHDCWTFTGHCAYFDFVGCDKWMNGCFECPAKSEYPKSVFADNSAENYKRKKRLFTGIENMTIITPSQWLAGLVGKSFLSGYKTVVIPNGIDLSVFTPTESDFRETHGLQKKKILLGVANVWDRRKGLYDLIELSQNLDSEKYKIVAVGVTENQKNQLPKQMLGITRTDNIKQLAEIYTASDVFVNPTYEDNFPTTNLEALACGTPVVTYNTGGSAESITDSCGMIAPERTAKSLAEAIEKCESFDSAQCVEQAKKYNARNQYNKYIDLYIKIKEAE